MEIRRATLDTCAEATGAVVVIDVLRAFSTAAYAFAAGAADILLVGTVEEALALREANPGSLVMGEVRGRPPEGFDFGNSPSALLQRDLSGRRLIQRTSAGTQGVVRSQNAHTLLPTSLCVAGATVDYLRQQAATSITLVITDSRPGGWGEEDEACADYLEGLLKGEEPDWAEIVSRVRGSRTAGLFTDPASTAFPPADVDCAVDIDRFDFAMLARRQGDLLVMEPFKP